MTLPQFPISGLEQWRVHIQNSITSDAIKNGYTKLNILDSLNFEKLSLDSNEMCQHSVMYTSCDIRELAMQCSDENNEYIVMILKLIFHKFLELLKISNDLPEFLSSSNSSKSKEWIRCRTVHVNCHSLPLSTPGDWLNCDDIEHMTHNNADPLYFHDMFYICIPIRLKHSCTHEDQSRESVNIVAQKEMAILLTKQFADLYNHIINMKLKENEYLPLNIDNWAKYYPANSLRVGLFTTLKVSTLHLYRLNPTIFTSPLFIHPLKLNNCSSCSYAWLRKKKFKTDTLVKKIKKQKLDENITSTNNNINTVEAHILALETKNLVFLNGPEVNRNNIIIHRAIKTRINGTSTNNQQPQYVGEIGWPGKTANETIDSKYLIGFSNLDFVAVGVLETDEKSSSPNIDNTSTIENWNQGGEIALKFKGKDLEIVGMVIDDYIIQEKCIDNLDNDTTEGPTILIRLCSKYSVIPYFGLRSLLRFHDSLVYNSSALGIASNNQSKQMNISVHLLCCICKFLTIREFAMFRSICRSHCNRIIFNSYIHEIALEEKDLYLPILGQLYPYLSKAKSIRVLQSQTSSFDNMQLIPPIVIQCLAAYTPRAKKMIFSNHSPANLAKIVSRACGRKPEMIVLTKNVNIVNDDGEEEDEGLNRINLIDNITQEERISRTDQEESAGNSDLVDRNDNINNENIENNVTNNSGNLFDNSEGENNLYNPNTHGTQSEVVSQQLSMPTVPQPSPATTPNIQPHIAELSLPNLIEIHIIGIIESISIIPTSIFRIPATAPFRKLVRYFRDVVSIHEGIVDFYIVRYGIKDRLIPDLTPIDYGILRGPAVLHAIGYKTLQYSQKIWISLFLVGSRNFPYLAKLRFNASMSTPFSRLADSYSRNVNIAVSDVIFYYKDVEIDLSLSPFDYNVRENDTIEVSLRGRSGCQ